MLRSLKERVDQYDRQIAHVDRLADLEQLRVSLLGKQGILTTKLREIGKLPTEERPAAGQQLQKYKEHIKRALDDKKRTLSQIAVGREVDTNQLDVSLPGWGQEVGAMHPVTHTRTQLEAIFTQVGFELKMGNEVEHDENNFTALNIPCNHPARTMHDTFYIQDSPHLLLRTHTSAVQIHALKETMPPLKMISTGAVYRCDSDVTHTPMFHQLEGMVVDKTCHFMELKGLLTYFLQTFFEDKQLVTRFRASYFPFTEPSAEIDIQCLLCSGKKCSFCSHTGWLEVLGCGMMHPNVLRHAGVDARAYQGYAFGIGIERLTLLYYRIPDIRLLFENDSRLLNQF